MDSNSIVYDAVREIDDADAAFEAKLIKAVCRKIDEYIKLIQPTDRVMIAFDGVAPVAKLDQQRIRRYKSLFGPQKESKWSTVAITPGTLFMKKLGNAVKKRFPNAIVTAADEAGEGEHKIYEHIRNDPLHHSNTTTVVYGLDADLIMLTLHHLHVAPSMYLFRETPEFIKSLDKTLSPNENYLLDIPKFGEALQKTSGIPHADYIFSCFLLGNDFLPHFPALNIRTTGIETLLATYGKTINENGRLVNGTAISWKNLRKLVAELAANEEALLRNEYKVRERQSQSVSKRLAKMDLEERYQATPLVDRRVETYINLFEPGWEERYYSKLFDIKIDDERRKEICLNYLEGLEWTLKYYTSGCVDWRWRYKYDYPPLFSDLVRYIPYFDTELVSTTKQVAVTPFVQLAYVLPGKHLDLLPKRVKQRLLTERPDWYADDALFEWAFTRYMWEAHAHLPEKPIDELESLIVPL
jgi:5'-3' exonuclease